MKVKTITYQRVLNLGNYESKRLEMTIEVDAHLELAEEECSTLMECVERKIREDKSKSAIEEIRQLRQQIAELQKLQQALNELKNGEETPPVEQDSDDIPFDNSNF